MKPTSNNNEKSKANIQEKEENLSSDIPKEKNLERFIYYTTYNDINFIEKINPLFEEINQKAFNLRSPKEIYTFGLSQEDRDNNEIDYISGFQIIDKISRLTIIEGITGKAMKKVKETFPKTQMNSKTLMVFSDSKILFNKRLYSIFDLSLKFIKIRMNLTEILTTFDIYLKSNKYREIYDAFMNMGSILKAETLKEIAGANLFPNGESLLLLERKYGDILKEEDLTGIKIEKKIKRKYSITSKLVTVTKSTTQPLRTKDTLLTEEGEEYLLKKNLNSSNNPNDNFKNNKLNSSHNSQKFKKLITKPINISLRKGLSIDNKIKKRNIDPYNRHIIQTEPNQNYNKRIINIGPRVIANNRLYRSILKNREDNFSTESSDIFEKNKEYIIKMKRKQKPEKLWKPFEGEYDKSKQINFYAMRNNYYEEVVNKMREKYLKDKNHFYTYSELALTLSFPMIDKFRNEEYLKYLDNKSKWIVSNDFDRYKQPTRDKVYFPKIDKEI
jgi:regulator of sigma D